jgi:hypothetical protein
MTSIVQFLAATSSAFCTARSVSRSIDAVASSSASTRLFLSSARARQTSWRWPTERFSPPGEIGAVELAVERGDKRLERDGLERLPDLVVRVLLERVEVGAHGALEQRRVLRNDGDVRAQVLEADLLMSTSSIRIAPSAASTRRKSASISDDLPAPVRPTTPTRSPG